MKIKNELSKLKENKNTKSEQEVDDVDEEYENVLYNRFVINNFKNLYQNRIYGIFFLILKLIHKKLY